MNKELILKFFIFITVFLFILSFIKALNYDTPILNMPSAYNVIDVNISSSPKNTPFIIYKINNNYIKSKVYKNVIRNRFYGKIKTFDILVKNGIEKNIKDIVIFNDIKLHYFKDFSKFKKEDFEYNNEKYTKYKVPNSVMWNKNLNSYNDRGILNIFCICFLSIFSNLNLALLPFMALIITLIYYINLKGGLPKVKYPYVFFAAIFLSAVLLRLNTLYDNVIPWGDECYSILISDFKLPLSAIFKDAGNPPLFYLLVRMWFSVFNISLISAKTFPFIISIVSLFTLWFALKKTVSINAANFGLFTASINLPLIYYSGEIRGYILEIALLPLLVYFLFQIFKTDKNKYYILYLIFAFIISNVHFYSILFLIANFIYSIFYFLKNGSKKSLIKFLIINAIAMIPFLYYFLLNSYKNGLINSNFNNWIPDLSINLIKECLLFAFQGIISLVLAIVFFIKNIYRKNSFLINYLFINMVLIFILSVIISLFIKNIVFYTYFIALFPLFIMFISCVFEKEKNKFMPILFLIWVLFIQMTIYPVQNRRKGFFEYPISFANQYIKENNPNGKIYVMAPISPYKIGYEKYYTDKINYAFNIDLNAPVIQYDKSFFKENNWILFTSLYDMENKGYNQKCFYNEVSKAKVCYLMPYSIDE